MNINVVNDTSYKKISVRCGQKEVFLGRKESCCFENVYDYNVKLRIHICDKNRMMFNFFDFIFIGIVDSESFVFDLHSDVTYELSGEKDDCTVFLKDITSRDDKAGVIHNSVYLYSDDVSVEKTGYQAVDTDKVRKKYGNIFFLFWLPALIFSALGIAFIEDTIVKVLSVVIFSAFLFFTYRRKRKAKYIFSGENAAGFLAAKELEYRMNNNRDAPYEPEGKIEKGIFKLLDNIFKK